VTIFFICFFDIFLSGTIWVPLGVTALPCLRRYSGADSPCSIRDGDAPVKAGAAKVSGADPWKHAKNPGPFNSAGTRLEDINKIESMPEVLNFWTGNVLKKYRVVPEELYYDFLRLFLSFPGFIME
jgi:hypothetical protein